MDKRAYIHFRKRCEQRFGIVLSEAQVEQIGELCRDGSYPRIRPVRDAVGLHRVRMGREMAVVVYDSASRNALTIMPLAWAGRAHRLEREREIALATGEAAHCGDFDLVFERLEAEVADWCAARQDACEQMRAQRERLGALQVETEQFLADWSC